MKASENKRQEELDFRRDILPLKDKIFRLSLRITLNRQDAEDAVQDTLLRIWNERRQHEVGSLEALATTICRNRSLDIVARREQRNISLDDDRHDTLDNALLPDERMAGDERYESLARAIAQLPEKQRTALELRDVEGHSYREIADMMDIGESDVKVNIFRARQRLKLMLTQQNENK